MKRILLAGSLAVPLYAGLGALGPAGESPLPFLSLYLGAFALYVLATLLLERAQDSLRRQRSLWLGILAVGLLARLALLPMPASDDAYRYLWEGRLQNLGGNPYLVAPEDGARFLPPDSPPDPFRGRVNHPHLTTIYPPLAELVFRAVAAISYGETGLKCAILLSEAFLIAALVFLLRVRRRPLSEVLRYVWNPLPILAFAGEGHADPLMLTGTWIAFLALEKGLRYSAGLAWGASIGGKVISAAYLPVFLRKGGWRSCLIAVLVLFVLVRPYREAGTGLFEVLFLFGSEMRHNGSIHPVLLALFGDLPALILVAGLFAAFALGVWLKRPEPLTGAFILTGAFLLLSPTLHPWYATWIVPFLVFRRSAAWLLFTGTVGLAYVAYGYQASTGVFQLPLAWRFLEYLPFYLVGSIALLRSFLASRSRLNRATD